MFVTGTDLNCSSSVKLFHSTVQYSVLLYIFGCFSIDRCQSECVLFCVLCCLVLPARSDWSPRCQQTYRPSYSCCRGRSQPDPRPTAPSPPARLFRWARLLHSVSIVTRCTLKVLCIECFRKPPDSVFHIKGTGRQLTRTETHTDQCILLCIYMRTSVRVGKPNDVYTTATTHFYYCTMGSTSSLNKIHWMFKCEKVIDRYCVHMIEVHKKNWCNI